MNLSDWLFCLNIHDSSGGTFSKELGSRYPLEMHIIHRNKNYFDLNQAMRHKDGIVVLAFFFRVSKVTLQLVLYNDISQWYKKN